jgi:hypothetical protein
MSPVLHKGKLVEYPDSSLVGADQPKRYALVVGIESFSDPAWGNLRYAKKDAQEIAKAFDEFDEVKLLTKPGSLTRENIILELDRIVAKAQLKKDTILVYISSHGTLDYSPSGPLERYIVLEDTDSKRVFETAVSVSELISRLESTRSKRRAAILAFCHSGEGKSKLSQEMKDDIRLAKAKFLIDPLIEVSEATIVLSASAWGETAREDTQLEQGLYTHFLLEGIKQGDRNKDGATTLTEAHDYARDRTYYYSQGRQRPSAKVSITGVDPIIIRGVHSKPGLPEIDGNHPSLSGLDIWVDGQNKGTLPKTVAVEPGTRLVEIRRPGQETALVESLVELKTDQMVEALELIPELPELVVGAGPGGLAFLDADNVLPDLMPSLGLSIRLSNWPYPKTWFELNFDGSYRENQLDKVGLKADTSLYRVGGAFGWKWKASDFRFLVGPCFGALWIHRSFSMDLDDELSFVPWAGILLGTEYHGLSPIQLGLNLRSSYMPLSQDDNINHMAIFEALFVVSFITFL